MNLHRRLDPLDAARRRRLDAFVASLSRDDKAAIIETLATVHATVAWRGDAECERAFAAVEDVAAGVAGDSDLGPWQDAGVRRAARRLVEVVRQAGYRPWAEAYRREVA